MLMGAPQAASVRYVGGSDVNLRKSHSTTAGIVTTLDLNVKVFVVKKRANWALVSVPLKHAKGWVLLKYLRTKPVKGVTSANAKGPPKAVNKNPPIVVITGDKVNLRKTASLRSKVVGSIPTNAKAYIITQKDPWYEVSVPRLHKSGWVFGDFVKRLNEYTVKADGVNLRKSPSRSAHVIMQVDKGERFVEKKRSGEYLFVSSPHKGYTGWISRKYLAKLGDTYHPTYVIKGTQVNFRRTPTVDAHILKTMNEGTAVKVLGREEKWTLVKYGDKKGWVYSEYLVPQEKYAPQGKSSTGERMISHGMDLRGVPYVWAGQTAKGFDCSGLIYYLLQNDGGVKDPPRTAHEQFAGVGVPVDKEDLERGDLVFFHTYGHHTASHVGIYLGDGDFLHASSAKGRVVISNMSEGYYKTHFVGARRVKPVKKESG